MSHSLKDKRRQIKSLKDRIRQKFNVSIAEVDYMDSWQKSLLAMCLLSTDKSYLDAQAAQIENLLLEYAELEMADIQLEWL